jgi:hypothetical protein
VGPAFRIAGAFHNVELFRSQLTKKLHSLAGDVARRSGSVAERKSSDSGSVDFRPTYMRVWIQ